MHVLPSTTLAGFEGDRSQGSSERTADCQRMRHRISYFAALLCGAEIRTTSPTARRSTAGAGASCARRSATASRCRPPPAHQLLESRGSHGSIVLLP